MYRFPVAVFLLCTCGFPAFAQKDGVSASETRIAQAVEEMRPKLEVTLACSSGLLFGMGAAPYTAKGWPS